MKLTKIVLLLIISYNFSYSQVPNIVWSKYFGGSRGEAKSIQKTSDGGYIIAGIAENPNEETVDYHGNNDGFVVKLNASFETEWSKCYGTELYEQIKQIKQTNDGGYVFVGRATVNYPNQSIGATRTDYWIVRIDSLGNIIWEKKYGGSAEECAFSVDETVTGEFIINGYSRSADGNVGINLGFSDYWMLKLDSTGNIILNKKYGGPENDFGYASVVNADGSYVLAGETFSETGQVSCRNPALICESDFWIVKSNTLGNITWARCFGSMYTGTNYFNTPYNMIKTLDNGYIVVGSGYDSSIENTFGRKDFWVRKIDANGNLQWKKFYGGSEDDQAYSVKQTADGGYVIVGGSYSADDQVTVNLGQYSYENGWIIKISSTGNLIWQKSAGSSGFGWDYFNDVIEVGNNEYIVVGKADKSNDDCVQSNGRGFWVTKISTNNLNNDSFSSIVFKMYPNPTEEVLRFEASESIKNVSIHDTSGRIVFEQKSDDIKSINISSLSNGIYTINVATDDNVVSRKVIKH